MSIFFIVFLVIFAPVVNSKFGAFSDLSLFVSIIIILIGIFKHFKLNKSLIHFMFLFISISALSIANTFFVSDQIDIDSLISILKPLKGLIYFFAIYFIFIFIFNHRKIDVPSQIYEDILNIVYICISIHAVIIVAQYMFPSFREFIERIIINQGVLSINRSFRMPGLTGAGGAQVSAVQGFGFMLGMHLLLSKKKWYVVFLFNAIILESIIMTGRTGFILVFIGLLYWVFSVMILVENRKKIKYILVFIVAFITTFAFYNYLTNLLEGDLNFERSVNRTFKSYNHYRETGEFADDTVEALSNMFDLPHSMDVILIGDGRQLNNRLGNYSSDIGYIRLWWSYGILGLSAFIFVYSLIGYYIRKPFVIKIMGKQNVLFGMVMLFSVFILNYKEVFFLSRNSTPILIFSTLGLYWLAFMDRNRLQSPTQGHLKVTLQ